MSAHTHRLPNGTKVTTSSHRRYTLHRVMADGRVVIMKRSDSYNTIRTQYLAYAGRVFVVDWRPNGVRFNEGAPDGGKWIPKVVLARDEADRAVS